MEKRPAKLKGLLLALTLVVLVAAGVVGRNLWQSKQEERLRAMSTTELEALVKKRPSSTATLYALGLAYAQEGKYSLAVKQFLAALEKEPTRADILNDLSVAYILQSRYYEALVVLQGALQLKPNYAEAYANMGRLHIATKMPFTAVKELEKADSLEPNKVATLCDLGQAYQRTLNYKSALVAFQRAIEKDRKSAQSLVGAGQAYYAMTQYDKAEESLKQALVLAPDDANALLALGRVQWERAKTSNDLTTVQTTLEKAIRADQSEAEGWYMLGRLKSRLGKNDEALEMQKRALRIEPDHTAALYQLERCLRAIGRTADANRVAQIYEKRKLHARRESQLEEQITHNPNDWDSRAELTQLYIESGKRSLAVLLCKRIQDEKPDHPMLPKLLQALNTQSSGGAPNELLKGTTP